MCTGLTENSEAFESLGKLRVRGIILFLIGVVLFSNSNLRLKAL